VTATDPAAAVVNTLPARPTNTPTQTFTPSPPPTRTPTNTPTASSTPLPTFTPLPPEGVRGVESLLTLAGEQDEPTWALEQFSLAEDGVSWRLGFGSSTGTEGGVITVALPAAALETRYGNNAASRIISMEADVLLQTYNPALLIDGGVYFGILLQDAADATQNAGLRIDLADVGVINIGQVENSANSVVLQRSLGEVRLRLRLDYNPDSGALTTYINGEPIGLPLTFTAPTGVLPALFVRDGGVVVYVSSWTVALR
jgi:hypothetical protein